RSLHDLALLFAAFTRRLYSTAMISPRILPLARRRPVISAFTGTALVAKGLDVLLERSCIAALVPSLLLESSLYLVPLTSRRKAVVERFASQAFMPLCRLAQSASSSLPFHVSASPRPDNAPAIAQMVISFRITVILSYSKSRWRSWRINNNAADQAPHTCLQRFTKTGPRAFFPDLRR